MWFLTLATVVVPTQTVTRPILTMSLQTTSTPIPVPGTKRKREETDDSDEDVDGIKPSFAYGSTLSSHWDFTEGPPWKPTDTVTFHVGKEAEPFVVHKGIVNPTQWYLRDYINRYSEFACHYSPVLNAAFNSEFVESQTWTYCLEDDEFGPFRISSTGCTRRK